MQNIGNPYFLLSLMLGLFTLIPLNSAWSLDTISSTIRGAESTPESLKQDRVMFPFHYSPDAQIKRYAKFRAEGLSLKQALPHGIDYLRKYIFKKLTAPVEELNYFKDQKKITTYLRQSEFTPSADATSLAFVGDIMWLRKNWNNFLSKDVQAYLSSYDVVLGNLESPISKSQKVPSFLPDYASYNSPAALMTSFKHQTEDRNIFTAVSVANNHTLDKGDLGVRETMDFLDQIGVAHAGVSHKKNDSAKKYITFEKNGIKFGFYAATWGINNPAALKTTAYDINMIAGLAPLKESKIDVTDVAEVLKQMQEEGVNFKILSLHWGYEFELYPAPEIMKLARQMAQAGADLIIGSHPHVQQPLETCFLNGYEKLDAGLESLVKEKGCVLESEDKIQRKTLIAYSMGNFLSTMYTHLCRIGLIESIQVQKNDITGHYDWHKPAAQLVYNTTNRRLILYGTQSKVTPILAGLRSQSGRPFSTSSLRSESTGDWTQVTAETEFVGRNNIQLEMKKMKVDENQLRQIEFLKEHLSLPEN